jgi:uncharacterized membrane protein YcaP (DUF421 family)
MQADLFFDNWSVLARTVIIAATAYPAMLIILRMTGQRTLTQMNAFDLIVTVALGSTLASVITSKDISLSQGLAAFFLLAGMQFGLSWIASRSDKWEHILNGEPVLLVYQGKLLGDALRRTRLTNDEIMAALRSQGLGALGDVETVVLETNGRLSVVPMNGDPQPSALRPVPAYPTTAED